MSRSFSAGEAIKRRAARKEALTGWAFILPGFLGFGIFILVPVICSLILSFTSWNFMEGLGAIRFNGGANFIKMWSDDWFKASLRNNLLFTAVTVPVCIALSLLIANVINRVVYCKTVIKVMFFIPYIASTVAVCTVWMVLLQPNYGVVNQLLAALGVQNLPGWLVDSKWSLASIMLIYIWQEMGYYIIVYMAAMKSVPTDLYEAAQIDGASAPRQFFKITIPMVAPTTFFNLVMGIISSFRVFDHVSVLTQGGPGNSSSVMAFYIYRTAFKDYKMGYANAMAWILFLFIFIVTMLQWRMQDKFTNE